MEWQFDFVVYPMTAEQAAELMERIVHLVEEMDCSVGGGPRPYSPEVDDEQE